MKNFKYSLSIATEPLGPSAPVIWRGDIDEIIAKAKNLGYDAIELQLRDPEKIDAKEYLAKLEAAGMKISGIATGLEYSLNGLSMIDDDETKRNLMMEKLYKDVELAEAFGCVVIIGCVRGNIPATGDKKEYTERFAQNMIKLADKAKEHGVTVVLEAINFYVNNYLNSIKDTCDFIDSLGRDNIKLHMDTHHMAIEENNILDAVRYAGERIGYVHFSDNNRWYPGHGSAVNYLGVMQILEKIGYDEFITFEVGPFPTGDEAAAKAIEFTKKLEGLLDFTPADLMP